MNRPVDRRKLMWLLGGAGVLLVGLLFISTLAPSAHPGEDSGLTVQPESFTTTGSNTNTGTQAQSTTDAESGGGGFSLDGGQAVSLMWRLLLVVLIIGGSIAGLRWWGKRASAPKSQTGYVRVVDTLPISNGRAIHLVALGDRVIAVGATAQQMSLLTELDDRESAEVLARMPQAGESSLGSFASELMQSLQRGTATRRETRTMPTRGEQR